MPGAGAQRHKLGGDSNARCLPPQGLHLLLDRLRAAMTAAPAVLAEAAERRTTVGGSRRVTRRISSVRRVSASAFMESRRNSLAGATMPAPRRGALQSGRRCLCLHAKCWLRCVALQSLLGINLFPHRADKSGPCRAAAESTTFAQPVGSTIHEADFFPGLPSLLQVRAPWRQIASAAAERPLVWWHAWCCSACLMCPRRGPVLQQCAFSC